ncbi:hypothetical protein MRB53_037925 [Persea americana]|nr:hypothetical protein MRB53_037925 [Persea americana]
MSRCGDERWKMLMRGARGVDRIISAYEVSPSPSLVVSPFHPFIAMRPSERRCVALLRYRADSPCFFGGC